jgi:cell division protein FtsA
MLTRPHTRDRTGEILGVLDIGTSKTACVIVAAPKARGKGARRAGEPRVLGFGLRPSRGLKAGVVIELDEAEHAVRAAVTQAEQMAGVTLETVSVAVTCGGLRSQTFEADARIEGRLAGDGDVDRLMAAGREYAQRDGRTLLHLNCIAYRLDGIAGVSDPRGMAGTTLAADLHAVTADDAPLRNLLHVVERAYLSAARTAPTPCASGLAATSAEERRHGVLCIDMGAGTTSLSMFADGRLLWIDTLAVGGQHVTFDIARALSTTFDEAERIKTLYGTLTMSPADGRETVAHTLLGDDEPALYQTTRAHIHGIVSNRVADLLAYVLERIEGSGVAHLAAYRVVVTGGASQLPGMGEFAARMLAMPARTGGPQAAWDVPEDCRSPSFSTAIGLVDIALDPAARVPRERVSGAGAGYFKRVGDWLREGF